jgi:hypothetical protein
MCLLQITMGPSEQDIQEWIVDIARSGSLHECISGQAEAKSVVAAFREPDYVPAFPIDYLLRKRSAEGAIWVLEQLPRFGFISERRSISANRSERLHPDLVLGSPDAQAFAIVEIKADGKTSREAITELLAYDLELQNHFPFCAQADRGLVIIATEFPPLLDHAVAGLVAWEQRNVLCLTYCEESGNKGLAVHLPSSWSRMGQVGIPASAIRVCTLMVACGEDDAEARRAADRAFDMAVREADRLGGHGFGLCWDCREPVPARALTFGTVSAPQMLAEAIASGFVTESSDPLTAWFSSQSLAWTSSKRTPPYLDAVLQRILPSLEMHGQVAQSFDDNWNDAWARVRRSGGALVVEFWGTLGDYARALWAHQGLAGERSNELFFAHDWRAPSMGIPLINDLCGRSLFAGGSFGLLDFLQFGVAVGSYSALLDIAYSDPTPAIDDAISWYKCELLPSVRAISLRCNSVADIPTAPVFKFGCVDHCEEASLALEEWLAWLYSEFLPSGPLHKLAFSAGFETALLHDSYWANRASLELLEEIRGRGRALVGDTLALLGDDKIAPTLVVDVESVRTELSQILGSESVHQAACSARSAEHSFDDASLDKAIRGLFSLLDPFTLPLPHRIAPMQPVPLDCDWLRRQVQLAHDAGQTPCGLLFQANGDFGVSRFQDHALDSSLPEYDPQTHVVVGFENGGETTYVLTTWALLRREGVADLQLRVAGPRAGPTGVSDLDYEMLQAGKQLVDQTGAAFDSGANVLAVVDVRDPIGARLLATYLEGQEVAESDAANMVEQIRSGLDSEEISELPLATLWLPRVGLLSTLSQLGFSVPDDWQPAIENGCEEGKVFTLLKRIGVGVLMAVDYSEVVAWSRPAVVFGDDGG